MFLLKSIFLHPAGRVFAVLAIGGLLYSGYAVALRVTGNFHTVVTDELYRAAQPTGDDLARYHKKYGIRTIVNLRGHNPEKNWYQNEVRMAEKLGIKHIDFGIPATSEMKEEKAKALIAVLRDAPKPILIHCFSGADRTGLASALYLAAISLKDVDVADDQLSLRFGHVPIPLLSPAFAMDESFENLEPMLGVNGS